jgi:acetyltransferase-like isoleucine patch superfamily enzyme
MGKNVMIQPRIIPLYPELISFHNNVWLASRVNFITHDVINHMLNYARFDGAPFSEQLGCIEIMDNVFIGAGVSIMYNVRIGSNVIIAAESVVTKDCEPNSVYAGIPARKIGTFQSFVEKRKSNVIYPSELKGLLGGEKIGQALTDSMWKRFEEEHESCSTVNK